MTDPAPPHALADGPRPMPGGIPIAPFIHTGVAPGPLAWASFPWPDDCGAEAVFLGRTRGERHPDLGRLIRLEYEAYEPMVLRMLEAMAHQASQRWRCGAVRVVHALGPVPLGGASVVVQVATPHRADSFAACRWLIEQVKAGLPVWKREVWEGGTTFVAGTPASPAGCATPESATYPGLWEGQVPTEPWDGTSRRPSGG